VDNQEFIAYEFEQRSKLETEARSILETATAENREPSAEEQERWDKIIAESDRRKARIEQLTKADDDAKGLEAIRSRYAEVANPDSGKPAGGSKDSTGLLFDAIRTLQTEFQRDGMVTTSGLTVVTPFDMRKIAEELRVVTDFGNGTSLYVSDFSTNVAVYMRTESPWLGNATIINADNGRPSILPNLTADPTSYTPGEGTAITAADPTLGTVTATPVSYKALAYISAEADEDETIGYMPLLAKSQARSLGQAFGSATTTAVLAAATNGGTATGLGGGATATFIGADDLITLQYGLAAPYRRVGAFVMSNGMIQKARKYKDLNGQYLWQQAVAPNQPDTFNGRPVYEDPYLATPESATKSVLFGDLSLWVIKQRALRTAVSYDYAFNLDNIAIKSVYRAGGALPDSAGLAYMVSADT